MLSSGILDTLDALETCLYFCLTVYCAAIVYQTALFLYRANMVGIIIPFSLQTEIGRISRQGLPLRNLLFDVGQDAERDIWAYNEAKYNP